MSADIVDDEKVNKKLNEFLKDVYYDEDKNTSSLDRLYQQAQEAVTAVQNSKLLKPLLTRKNLKAFIEKQGAFQRTKTFKTPPSLKFRSIIAPRVGSNLQADLMFFKTPYLVKYLGKDGKPKKGKGMYVDNVLNVLDIHSRKAWAIPNANKDAETVAAGFEKIVKEIQRDQESVASLKGEKLVLNDKGFVIKSLNSDSGKEFTNKLFEDLLGKYGINHYLSDKDDFAKNAIVERFNRTLRRVMIVDKEQNESKQFTEKDIPRYIKNYNNDIHSTIKAKPAEVFAGKAKNQQVYKFAKFTFKVGDIVRTLNKKALFEKGMYEYSKDLYKIIKIDHVKNYAKGKKVKTGQYKLRNIKTSDKLAKQYQGYELLLANSVQEKDGYDIVKAEKNIKEGAEEKKRAQVEAALNKDIGKDLRADIDEDYDIVQIEAPSSNKSKTLAIKPKDKIEVFWSDKGVMWEKRNKFTKKTKGKFYPATIKQILNEDDPSKIMYYVEFPEDKPPNKYKLNLTRKNKPDFVQEGRGWRREALPDA